jgi:hypothetical protein
MHLRDRGLLGALDHQVLEATFAEDRVLVTRVLRSLEARERGAAVMSERVTVQDFRRGPMFPRIERAVASILARGKIAALVDVLVKMDLLAPSDLDDWRFGRVPHLERVARGGLSCLSRLLHILGFHCHDLNLVPSHTAYVKGGKGPRTPLRFTKTGDERLEKIYARHFAWPGKGPFHPPRAKSDAGA